MSNALVTMQDMGRMAEAVAKSGLFGVKTADQAMALMLVAQAEGRHPAMAARDYDIIQGRPAKKTEAMLRDFLENQGKVEWHALDDTVADATFSHLSGLHQVVTLQGMKVGVRVGEWIVREPSNPERFYPIADDEFRKIYEPI